MKNKNPVFESVGEYKEIDDSLAHWYGAFKLWWDRKKAYNTAFKSCREYPKESNMIKDVIIGLNIKVYAIPDADRNAFVIPGYYVGATDNINEIWQEYRKKYPKHDLSNPFCVGRDFWSVLMVSQLKSLIQMRKFSYINDNKRPGKKKIVFKNVDTPISVFVTYGMLNHATAEERLGVYLHEIGHWVDSALNIPSHVLQRPDRESIFMYSTMCMQRFCTRYEELSADKFAKDLGYGHELAQALDSIVDVRKNIAWIHRHSDWMIKNYVEAQNYAEETGNYYAIQAYNYPSMKTRKQYLEDDK